MIDPEPITADLIRPSLDKLAQHGGMVLICLTHNPEAQNYSPISHGWFSETERKAFKACLTRAKKKRETAEPVESPKNALAGDSEQKQGD